VTGLIGYLKLVLAVQYGAIAIQTLDTSLEHAVIILALLSLHQSSGNGFKRQAMLFVRVSEQSPFLSHSNSRLSIISTGTRVRISNSSIVRSSSSTELELP
jgi:hypothetical protein